MINSVCFSPDGQRLASASDDGTVKVWAAKTRDILTLKGHSELVSSLCFSPDGQRLASASYDKTVKVWDAKGGRDLLTLKGHSAAVISVRFSSDGQRIITRSAANNVLVWDGKSGAQVQVAEEPAPVNFPASISPDGKTLAWPSGNRIYLIDMGPPPPGELAYRETATRLRVDWQQEQARQHEQATVANWHAAAFHNSLTATAEPHVAYHWQKLNHACQQLHDQRRAEMAKDKKFQLADADLLAWKHAADALFRVLKEKAKIDLKLPAANEAPGLHLSLALAHHRLGDTVTAKARFEGVQLPADASPGLTQLRRDVAAELGLDKKKD